MPDLRRTNKTIRSMAQASPQKLPRGKVETYSTVALSDTASVTPLLSDLGIASCNPSNEEPVVQPVVQAPEAKDDGGDAVVTVPTRKLCVCCSLVFAHRTEQKAHFKSDWHRYNLKQQLRGAACITEDTFETMTGDVSSISGSADTSTSSTEEEGGVKPTFLPRLKRLQVFDSANNTSDSDEDDNSAIMAATRKHPKVFLRNGSGQLVSLYRCVLYHKKWSPNTPAELLSLAQQAKTYTRVAMVMLAGGHFSAAIFDGTEAVVHKTFHRYVVRAKRGTVQSVRDGQGSAPKSGGATLRRYNEAALTQEVQELLTGWSPQLQACHLIFLRISAYSCNIFFGGKAPILDKKDPRVRNIPFATGRPTFNEAKRVHHMLMAVESFGDESLVAGFVPLSPPRHLHPDTGQLVVRPDTARSPVRPGKVKGRKAKGDVVQEAGKQEEAAPSGEEEDNSESDKEVELVAVMEEIRTDDLQEFACSVGPPRRNKKRKKKGGQRAATSEQESAPQAAPADPAVDTPQLSEEDTNLKNRLYTCCKSGDVTQLSQLLKELRDYAGHDSSSADLPQRGGTTTDSHHSNHLPQQLESQLSSPPQSSIVPPPSSTHPHTAHSKESVRTSGTDRDRVNEAMSNSVGEQESEADTRSEQRTDTAENCDPGNNKLTESQTPHAPVLSSEHSVPRSDVGLEASSLPTHADDGGASQNSGGDGVPPCGADPLVLEGRARFEAVVLGRYGDRGSSLLHVAASSGHGDVLTALLDAGCDPCVRDGNGKTPYTMAGTKDVRNVFRRFRGNHPDRFDYDAAQIPSALTADMESDRKQRDAEKRKQQKKAKQERLYERKAEDAKAAQEKKEKERFLNMSDREKRALAAERRLLTQATAEGASVVLNRCFQCGADMSGKVPFEYMEFKFCSPKCLKEHRTKGSK